jgi:hypothetical protein
LSNSEGGDCIVLGVARMLELQSNYIARLA